MSGLEQRQTIEQQTITTTLTPLITALAEADKVLGPNRAWVPSNDKQAQYLDRYFPKRAEIQQTLARASADDPLKIRSIASRKAEEINQFLAERGFNIALEPFRLPSEFGTASVMDVLVKWIFPGKTEELRAANGKTYPGAKLKEAIGIDISDATENPVAYIPTQHEGYSVGLTIPAEPIRDDFELVEFVERVRKSLLYPALRYEGLLFPKISLDQKVDISWARGMRTLDQMGVPAEITQALQQTKFRMNEIGARAQSAVAFGIFKMGISLPKEPLVIDKPFVAWIQKEGISLPLFAAYIDYSDWKDPGSLE